MLKSVECDGLGKTMKCTRCLTQGKQRALIFIAVSPSAKLVGILGAMDAELGANLELNLARQAV